MNREQSYRVLLDVVNEKVPLLLTPEDNSPLSKAPEKFVSEYASKVDNCEP
jgi:hypothetical protein